MKFLLLKIINFYQRFLSKPIRYFLENFGFVKNNTCVFYPSCSEYSKQAIKKYGILKGSYLSFSRIIRCHPWQKNHFDPLI